MTKTVPSETEPSTTEQKISVALTHVVKELIGIEGVLAEAGEEQLKNRVVGIREALAETLQPTVDMAEAQRIKDRIGKNPSTRDIAQLILNNYYKPSTIQKALITMLLEMDNVEDVYLTQILEDCEIEDKTLEVFIAAKIAPTITRKSVLKIIKRENLDRRSIQKLLSTLPMETLSDVIINPNIRLQVREIAIKVLVENLKTTPQEIERLVSALEDIDNEDSKTLLTILYEQGQVVFDRVFA